MWGITEESFLVIFDVTARSMIGKFEHKIVRSGCCRLNSKNKASRKKYSDIVEEQMICHKVQERIDALLGSRQ